MKGLLVCVCLLVLCNFDLSVSSCEDGQSVKDKMENYFVNGLCGGNAAMFLARDADVSWDGVQFSELEDIKTHFEAFKNNGFRCEILSLDFNSVTVKAQVQLGITMMSKMTDHVFAKNDEEGKRLNEFETKVDGKTVNHDVHANLTLDGKEWIIQGLIVDKYEL